MTVETYTVQLERVQAAIAKVEEKGQSVEIASDGTSRRYTRADLATLYKRERDLRPLAASESTGRRRGIRVSQGIARW